MPALNESLRVYEIGNMCSVWNEYPIVFLINLASVIDFGLT